ncbi:hypothetical protein ACVNF4_12285 [Streptomyces sp. S6]
MSTQDARLDPYRRGAARLVLDGREVGLLVTRVNLWPEYVGWLWRKRVESEQELPEWMVWPAGSSDLLPEGGHVWSEDLDGELADWSAGVFRLPDTVYTLEWLPPTQAEAAHREFGWDMF